jgi:hypothetical protein
VKQKARVANVKHTMRSAQEKTSQQTEERECALEAAARRRWSEEEMHKAEVKVREKGVKGGTGGRRGTPKAAMNDEAVTDHLMWLRSRLLLFLLDAMLRDGRIDVAP